MYLAASRGGVAKYGHTLQSLVGGCGVNLGAKVGSGGTGSREVLCEDWLEEGAEDELSATEDYISMW